MSDPASPSPAVAAAVAARLAQLWAKSRPVILERIEVLRTSHAALIANPDDVDARTRGREAAHKLSGVLGTFGLPGGSEAAHRIEACLASANPLTEADRAEIARHIDALDTAVASKP
jgi:HPt (histidine-containing phosphotransfer) domain-containing protein